MEVRFCDLRQQQNFANQDHKTAGRGKGRICTPLLSPLRVVLLPHLLGCQFPPPIAFLLPHLVASEIGFRFSLSHHLSAQPFMHLTVNTVRSRTRQSTI